MARKDRVRRRDYNYLDHLPRPSDPVSLTVPGQEIDARKIIAKYSQDLSIREITRREELANEAGIDVTNMSKMDKIDMIQDLQLQQQNIKEKLLSLNGVRKFDGSALTVDPPVVETTPETPETPTS